MPRPDYARHLLDIAGALSRPLPGQSAIAMAQTSRIKGRIAMILDHTRRRSLPRRFLMLAALTGAAAIVPLSMLQPTAKAQAAPSASASQQEAQQRKAKRQALARVSAVHAVPGELDANQLTQEGSALTPQEAAAMKHKLADQPDDYAAHLTLLGYYLHSTIYKTPLTGVVATPAYRQQVFWLIRNHPESVLFSTGNLWVPRHDAPAVFAGDDALWQAQIAKYPSSAVILGNAASYYTLSNESLAEKYLLQAQALEPESPIWPDKLGHLYQLEGEGPYPSAELVRQSAKKALAEYEKASMLANHTSQPNTSPDLAKTAFDAAEYEKARQYADALLGRSQSKQPTGFEPSDDIHAANLVLGRLALRDGDITEAEAHLLAMGRVSGSPVLGSFGPNMQLAKELLERGDRQPVLTYFDECAKFWTFGQAKATLATWTAEVKQGRIPDFRGNLDY